MKISTATWMFLDTETTGLKPENGDQVIELGWVVIKNLEVVSNKDHLINPGRPIPPVVVKITHITDEMVAGAPTFDGIAEEFLSEFQRCDFVAAYNKDFDRKMLETEFSRLGHPLPKKEWLDPLTWARGFINTTENHKLITIANEFDVDLGENAHRADADAAAAAEILIEFFRWGLKEANFQDDVQYIKDMEHSIVRNQRAKNNMMAPLKKNVVDPVTGKSQRKVVLTGEPGKYAQNVYDNYNRERLFKLMKAGRWGK